LELGDEQAQIEGRPQLLSRSTYFRELFRMQGELVKLQDWVVAKKLKVLVIFEGRDAAGKGGVIKRITQRLNPRTCRVVALTAPSERERTQWYFQRYVPHLPAGGEIIVRCEAADPSRLFPNENVTDHGDSFAGVILEVRDTGEGIAQENLPHVFEPYFSTRKEANATGLGLTVCESVAKAHGGSLSVQSQRGAGTTVRFFLPVDADTDEADSLAIGKTFENPTTMTPRILVLEDDTLVRSLIVRNLQSQNYEVSETVDGNDTVRLYQQAMQDGRPYHLIVLDLSIPNGMGGLRTMEKIRAMDPNVLAIVSSGYSDDPVMAQPAAYGFAAVLPKPYEPVELLRLVKSLISSRVSGQGMA
ncbi:MAG: ATP-binding protein, partial [Verrucomicrobiaceae bacterium]